MLRFHDRDGLFHEIPDHGFAVSADITDLGELGGFHLNERGLGQLREAPRDFRLADAGRSDHDNVLGNHFVPEMIRQTLAAPTRAQRDSHHPLGIPLADNVSVELFDNLPRR